MSNTKKTGDVDIKVVMLGMEENCAGLFLIGFINLIF